MTKRTTDLNDPEQLQSNAGVALRVTDMVLDTLCEVRGPAASDETVLKAQAGLYVLRDFLHVMAGEYAGD